MAGRYPSAIRLYPAWELSPPWSVPMSAQEQEGLAETALLAGVAPTNTAVSTLLSQFAGDYAAALQNAQA